MFAFITIKSKCLSLIRYYSPIILVVIIYALIVNLYTLALEIHYKSYLPTSFETDKSIFVGDRFGGFLEGCGVAVYQLSEETSKKIAMGGVKFLNVNSQLAYDVHRQYNTWRETPFTFEDGELFIFGDVANEDAGGQICVDIPDALKNSILLTSNIPRSFYTRFNKNTELIVIPNLRLAVFAHNR